MSKKLKYFSIFTGGLVLLSVVAVLVVPRLVDVQQYKPVIEKKISEATGRTVLFGDVKLSLFPWVGVSLADFQMANPDGFSEQNFLQVKAFQAHLKVMPLLSREIHIDKIVLESPHVHLEKLKNGKANWQGFGGDQKIETASKASAPQESASAAGSESTGFAVKSVEVGEIAIRDGKFVYADKQQGTSTRITDISLALTDVSMNRPLNLDFSAVYENKPLGLKGQIGPIAKDGVVGKGAVPVELVLSVTDQLAVKLSGQLMDVLEDMRYAFDVDIEPFSPRGLAASLAVKPFPVETSDPKALSKLGLTLKASGNANSLVIKDGNLVLDDSKMVFEANLASFSPVNITAACDLDSIDLDRYLPPVSEDEEQTPENRKSATGSNGSGTGSKGVATATDSAAAGEAIDYTPLRTIRLDLKAGVKELKVKGGELQNIIVQLKGNRGIFTIDPFSAELYSGTVSSTARLDVQKNKPAAKITAETANVQVGPMLQDFAQKDVLEGTLASRLSLSFVGDTAEAIKKSLDGEGLLTFTDGAIVGIDMAGMVRNVQASFGLAERVTEKPRTDFAELQIPFTIDNGLVNTPGSTLSSPLLRVAAAGSAHLVTEKIDMKVRPKFVATLKGQGDTVERSGIMVPIAIGGTFSKPTFAPDLAGLVQQGIPDTETLKDALLQELNPEKGESEEGSKTIEEGIKNLIPKLKF